MRIAGVNVGKVTDVEHLTERRDRRDHRAGRRRGADARRRTRRPAGRDRDDGARRGRAAAARGRDLQAAPAPVPRGQLLRRPAARAARTRAEIDDGHTFPVNQTAYSVQLDQVLTTLQGDVRADLQIFLNQFGNALIKHGGAEGFRELYRTSPRRLQVHVAGQRGPRSAPSRGDLARRDPAASTGSSAASAATRARSRTWSPTCAIFTGSFAAEDVALGAGDRGAARRRSTRREPAFANLNALASRRCAPSPARRCPASRSTPETLRRGDCRSSTRSAALVSERELRGLVADLRPTIPSSPSSRERTSTVPRAGAALSSAASTRS